MNKTAINIPEAVRSNSNVSVRTIEVLAEWLDNKFTIPGTNYKFGLDPILSLLPGAGNMISTGVSLTVFGMIISKGVPVGVAFRMMANIVLDFILSSLPILGTIFDVGYKSNYKNLILLKNHMAKNPTGKYYNGIWIVFGITTVVLIALTVGMIWLLAKLFSSVTF